MEYIGIHDTVIYAFLYALELYRIKSFIHQILIACSIPCSVLGVRFYIGQ